MMVNETKGKAGMRDLAKSHRPHYHHSAYPLVYFAPEMPESSCLRRRLSPLLGDTGRRGGGGDIHPILAKFKSPGVQGFHCLSLPCPFDRGQSGDLSGGFTSFEQ